MCVCLCVSVSHAGIVSKRLNVGSRKQRNVTAQGLSFLTPNVVGGRPLHPEICAQSDPPPFKNHNFDQLALIGSRPRAFQRAIDEPCTLSLSHPRLAQNAILLFLRVKFNFCRKSLLQSFLCENFQRHSCSYIIPLSNGP